MNGDNAINNFLMCNSRNIIENEFKNCFNWVVLEFKLRPNYMRISSISNNICTNH